MEFAVFISLWCKCGMGNMLRVFIAVCPISLFGSLAINSFIQTIVRVFFFLLMEQFLIVYIIIRRDYNVKVKNQCQKAFGFHITKDTNRLAHISNILV